MGRGGGGARRRVAKAGAGERGASVRLECVAALKVRPGGTVHLADNQIILARSRAWADEFLRSSPAYGPARSAARALTRPTPAVQPALQHIEGAKLCYRRGIKHLSLI